MAADKKQSNAVEEEWRKYTPETLQQMYDSFTEEAKKGQLSKEDQGLAVYAGYALDLIDLAKNIPNNPINLDLKGPTSQEDMSLVATFAAIAFRNEGPDAVRVKIAKMLAGYEYFTTMNTLLLFGFDIDCQLDETGVVIQVTDDAGNSTKIDLLARAKFAMARSIMPEAGEDSAVAIGLYQLYKKLHDDFVGPLLTKAVAKEESADSDDGQMR